MKKLLILAACAAVALSGCGGHAVTVVHSSPDGVRPASPVPTAAGHKLSPDATACLGVGTIAVPLGKVLAAAEKGPSATSTAPAGKWNQALIRDGNLLTAWASAVDHAATPNTELASSLRTAAAAVIEVAKGSTSLAHDAVRDVAAVTSICA